jgi:hypothetical protein
MVSAATAFDEEMVHRAEKRLAKMSQGKEFPSTLEEALRSVFRDDYRDPCVINLSSYSDQAVVMNNRIWKKLFSDVGEAPEMVNVELEKIVHMLLERDLGNPESLAWCVMFDPVLRKAVLRELDGARVCWDSKKLAQRLDMADQDFQGKNVLKRCGTHFFWGIDGIGRRIPLYLQSNGKNTALLRGVDDRGSLWEVPYTPQSVMNALNENRLLPSLFTCFLVLSFARGITCVGGYYQGEYLPDIKKKLVKALRQTTQYDAIADIIKGLNTHTYLSGMQLVMVRIKDDALIPAGPLEIIAGGGLTENDLQQILSFTVRDAHLASLFETVPDVAPWAIEAADWKDRLARECNGLLGEKVVVK